MEVILVSTVGVMLLAMMALVRMAVDWRNWRVVFYLNLNVIFCHFVSAIIEFFVWKFTKYKIWIPLRSFDFVYDINDCTVMINLGLLMIPSPRLIPQEDFRQELTETGNDQETTTIFSQRSNIVFQKVLEIVQNYF